MCRSITIRFQVGVFGIDCVGLIWRTTSRWTATAFGAAKGTTCGRSLPAAGSGTTTGCWPPTAAGSGCITTAGSPPTLASVRVAPSSTGDASTGLLAPSAELHELEKLLLSPPLPAVVPELLPEPSGSMHQ